jgi:hypothetical protein
MFKWSILRDVNSIEETDGVLKRLYTFQIVQKALNHKALQLTTAPFEIPEIHLGLFVYLNKVSMKA